MIAKDKESEDGEISKFVDKIKRHTERERERERDRERERERVKVKERERLEERVRGR